MTSASALKVCVVGAGAIGCTLAARLALNHPRVSVLARGATLTAIEHHGIHLTDLEGEHRVQLECAADPADLGAQDVVFICTKAPALPMLLPTLTPLIGPDTVVVPLVNGVPWWYFHGEPGRFSGCHVEAVDPGGTLSQVLDPRRILGCVVYITAEVLAPGVVRANNPHLVIVGEPDNSQSPRLAQVCALLGAAGVEARPSERIRDPLWTKIIANLTSNPLSVITRATLAEVYGEATLTPVVRKMLDESLLTAAAYGARIALDPSTLMAMGAGMGQVRTSMLQDYEQGRPLELAAIGEAVVELAQRQGLEMPVTRDILNLARFCGRLNP
jgi:2-dehydropantoate 2-reductase